MKSLFILAFTVVSCGPFTGKLDLNKPEKASSKVEDSNRTTAYFAKSLTDCIDNRSDCLFESELTLYKAPNRHLPEASV